MDDKIYKDDDLLEYIPAGLVLGFDKETAENGVKRLMREHNLPYTELSPNNIKFKYVDLKNYINHKTVNAPIVEEKKDDSIEALKLEREKSKVIQDTERDKAEFDAVIAETTLRTRLAQSGLATVENYESARVNYETLINGLQADREDINNRLKELEVRELKVKEQNERYQEYLRREHQIGERENIVFIKEQRLDDIEAQHNQVVEQNNIEIHSVNDANSHLGLLISNIKSDMKIVKCDKCGQ